MREQEQNKSKGKSQSRKKGDTELLLIIGWGMLVFCEMNTLYGSHAFTSAAAIIGCVVAAIFVIASRVCYLAYYDLEPMKGFYDGMIPLIHLANSGYFNSFFKALSAIQNR